MGDRVMEPVPEICEMVNRGCRRYKSQLLPLMPKFNVEFVVSMKMTD
jgi:hypothetical protein